MEVGFETIGNATILAYDRGPVLITDPWLRGPAYFGSWTFSHQVPEEQMQAAAACPYAWISHGHPDHLSLTKVTANVITTIAGTGSAGFNGDNLPALGTNLDDPVGVAVDPRGTPYEVDYFQGLVRRIR